MALRRCILILMLFNFQAQAQTDAAKTAPTTPANTLKSFTQLKNVGGPGAACDDPSKSKTAPTRPLMECSCSKPDGPVQKEAPLQIREFKSIDVLPSGLRDLAKKFRLAPGQPVKVLLRENNDAIFSPLGYLAMIVEPKMEDYTKPQYDLGNTHTMDLEVSKTSAQGTTYKLFGSTGLYTISDGSQMYLDSEKHKHQGIYFTEKNVLSFLVDNDKSAIGQKDKILWQAGAGIQTLNSEQPTALGASGQQDAFHHAANTKGQMPYYTYTSDGKPMRTSAFVDLGIGLSHQIAQNASCQVRVVGTLEPRIYSIPNYSTLTARTYVEGDLKKKKYKATFKAGAYTMVHQNGVQFTPVLMATYERKKWGLENSVTFPTGSLENSTNYNWTAHPMNTLAIFFYIGGRK